MQRVALDQELRFVSLEGIHPAADLLLLWCRMSPFSEKLGMALVELHSGTCLMVQERADMLWFMEQGLCQMSYDEDGGRDTIRYDTADGSWLYFGTAEDVYFVDAYSTMNPREDRARIMEYIMGAEDEADALAQCPVIRRKLEIMAAAVRAGFDTAGWGVARWEQPLTVRDRAA